MAECDAAVPQRVAVRIDDCDTVAVVHVLDDQIAQQGGFSRTRLADDAGMMAGVLRLDAQRHLAPPGESMSDNDRWVVSAHAARASPDSEATRCPAS